NRSDWDCTLEGRNVLRLGMRMIRGMPEAEAASVVSGRRQNHYAKVDDLWKRTELTRRGLDALAHAGALAGIAGDRRQALWRTMAADRIVDLLLDAPPTEDAARLRAPTEVDDLIADYHA